MAQINALIIRQKKGVLLTLGITFLSLVVLALATIILRSAETSEERLVELAGIDRLYNLGSSTERSLALALYPYTGLNFTIANDTLILERQMYPYPDTTLWNLDPSFFDYQLILRLILNPYLLAVSKGVNNITEIDPVSRRIWLNFLPMDFHYWLSTIAINITDSDPGGPYPGFLANLNETTPNSTHHILVFGHPGQPDRYIIDNYTFYFRHDKRNGYINWTRKEASTGLKKIRVFVQLDGPNGWSQSQLGLVYINDTKKLFPQVIYLDNLTGDLGCTTGIGCTPENVELRPSLRFYDGAGQQLTGGGGGTGIAGSVNAFIILNFNEKLFTRMTLRLNATYIEAYGTQFIQTKLDSFNMSRNRLARYA